jgi:hypothetical protein
MSEFKIGDKIKRVWESNAQVVQGSVYKIRGFDRDGDLELEGLKDFGYNEKSFDLATESDLQPTYTQSELSYIEELEDRVEYLESLCEDYVNIISEKDNRIESLKGLVEDLSGCPTGL